MQIHGLYRRAASIAVAGPLLLAATAGAQAWRGAGRAKGVVLDPAGNPVSGATISIVWAENEGGGPEPDKTDAKGRWSFIGLTAGDWHLKVEAEGFLPFEDDFPVYAQGTADTLRATLAPVPPEELEARRMAAINDALAEGNRLAAAGEHEAARAAYQKVLEHVEESKQAEVMAAIASTYVQQGRHDEAIRQLEQALAADADNETALRLMVSVLAAEGKDEEAKRYLARVPDAASLDPATQLNLGIMRYNEGQLDEAAKIFDRVLTEHPDRAEAYYFSGLVHLGKEENAVALERFEKFLELAPDHERAEEARQFLEHLRQKAAQSG